MIIVREDGRVEAGHIHEWYDISLMDAAVDEEICISLSERCGARRQRVRVPGIRLGPSPEPWVLVASPPQ